MYARKFVLLALLAWPVSAVNYIRSLAQADEQNTPFPITGSTNGNLASPRIIGGEDAGRFGENVPPWMVYSGGPDIACGGTLVSPDTVVTAAHCYDEYNNMNERTPERFPLSVVIGTRLKTPVDGRGLRRSVVPNSGRLHPDFRRGTGNSANIADVATYKLSVPVFLESYPVVNADRKFPGYDNSIDKVIDRAIDDGVVDLVTIASGILVVFGYGKFSNRPGAKSEIMRVMGQSYFENCGTGYSRTDNNGRQIVIEGNNDYNATSHVCAVLWGGEFAIGQDQGTCQGDSGGPLISFAITIDQIDDPFPDLLANNVATLVGIASFLGDDICASGQIDVYTRVSTYADWIQERIDDPVPDDDCCMAVLMWRAVVRFGQDYLPRSWL